MEIISTDCVPVTDTSSVGEVRRAAMTVGHRLGFNETRAGELALLATEVSRNVLVHGGGGQVIVAGLKNGQGALARILALDSGPGIQDLARAMADGYSTAGTMGGGLGAMKRLASALEIFTGPRGTIVLMDVGPSELRGELQVAGLTLAYPGERVCGDAWICHRTPGRTVALLTDGLGHGWAAWEAAHEATAAFREYADLPPAEILNRIHDALRKTRGAVGAVVEIRPGQRRLVYSGVGNISGVLISGGSSRSLVSHNDTLGVTISRIQEFPMEWPSDAVLVLHTDGVQTRWDLSGYAGLLARHAAIIGGALVRDFRRQRDDAGVLVIKAM